jgi:hypothetical protein
MAHESAEHHGQEQSGRIVFSDSNGQVE